MGLVGRWYFGKSSLHDQDGDFLSSGAGIAPWLAVVADVPHEGCHVNVGGGDLLSCRSRSESSAMIAMDAGS